MSDIDTPEPAPLTEQEMNQFITLAALPTLERALARLRWLEAEVATLKAQRDPLAKRKVVQLIALPLQGQTWNELYALCDDGTIWQRIEPQKWSQSLDIPQPQQEAKP